MKTSLLLLLFLFSFSAVHAEKISVVNYNTWGVPFAVSDTWRYAAAMEALEAVAPDVIVLEEVFSAKGLRAFRSYDYPYAIKGPHHFGKILNSGLKILSKFPILRSAKFTYRDCQKDDCLAGKGGLLVVLELPSGKTINLVATHLNARGEDAIRIRQIDQLSDFIRAHADPKSPTLISADLNFNPTAKAYQYLKQRLHYSDAWDVLHPGDPGITYSTTQNVYAHDYCVKTHFPLIDERIDFQLTDSSKKIIPTLSKIIFDQEPVYSDHYALYGEFEVI